MRPPAATVDYNRVLGHFHSPSKTHVIGLINDVDTRRRIAGRRATGMRKASYCSRPELNSSLLISMISDDCKVTSTRLFSS